MASHRTPLIGQGLLSRRSLQNQVALLYCAGSPSGEEAARALAWLGAEVIIADLDAAYGRRVSAPGKNSEPAETPVFVRTDVSDEDCVQRLSRQVIRLHGKVDILAVYVAYQQLGNLTDVPIRSWDQGYRLNLRAPLLLTQAFLPVLLQQDAGVVAFIAQHERASGIAQVFRQAQAALAELVERETRQSGVIVLSYDEEEPQEYTACRQGAGLAAAIALAPRYVGERVNAGLALKSAGIA